MPVAAWAAIAAISAVFHAGAWATAWAPAQTTCASTFVRVTAYAAERAAFLLTHAIASTALETTPVAHRHCAFRREL